jgi:hypothetical protein
MTQHLPKRPSAAPAPAFTPLSRFSMPLLRYRQAMAEYGPDAAQELIGVALPHNHLHFASTSD